MHWWDGHTERFAPTDVTKDGYTERSAPTDVTRDDHAGLHRLMW